MVSVISLVLIIVATLLIEDCSASEPFKKCHSYFNIKYVNII